MSTKFFGPAKRVLAVKVLPPSPYPVSGSHESKNVVYFSIQKTRFKIT